MNITKHIAKFESALDKFQVERRKPSCQTVKHLYNLLDAFVGKSSDFSKEDRENVTTYVLVYIEYITNWYDHEKEPGKTEIFLVKRFLGVLSDIFETIDIKNVFLEKATQPIFDMILEGMKLVCAKELLRAYNACIQRSSKDLRENVLRNMGSFHLCKLVDMLGMIGDFEYQTLIIETIYRLANHTILRKLKDHLIPECLELSKALGSINTENFDCEVRDFLNLYNLKNPNICSVICKWIMLDSIAFGKSPLNNIEGIWLDFDIKECSLSWTCDRNILMDSDSDSTADATWETIILNTVNVLDVKTNRCSGNNRNSMVVELILKGPCIATTNVVQPVIDRARNLKFFLADCEKINLLLTEVFRTIFGKRYHIKPEPSSEKKCYKPLQIKKLSTSTRTKKGNISTASFSLSETSSKKTDKKSNSDRVEDSDTTDVESESQKNIVSEISGLHKDAENAPKCENKNTAKLHFSSSLVLLKGNTTRSISGTRISTLKESNDLINCLTGQNRVHDTQNMNGDRNAFGCDITDIPSNSVPLKGNKTISSSGNRVSTHKESSEYIVNWIHDQNTLHDSQKINDAENLSRCSRNNSQKQNISSKLVILKGNKTRSSVCKVSTSKEREDIVNCFDNKHIPLSTTKTNSNHVKEVSTWQREAISNGSAFEMQRDIPEECSNIITQLVSVENPCMKISTMTVENRIFNIENNSDILQNCSLNDADSMKISTVATEDIIFGIENNSDILQSCSLSDGKEIKGMNHSKIAILKGNKTRDPEYKRKSSSKKSDPISGILPPGHNHFEAPKISTPMLHSNIISYEKHNVEENSIDMLTSKENYDKFKSQEFKNKPTENSNLNSNDYSKNLPESQVSKSGYGVGKKLSTPMVNSDTQYYTALQHITESPVLNKGHSDNKSALNMSSNNSSVIIGHKENISPHQLEEMLFDENKKPAGPSQYDHHLLCSIENKRTSQNKIAHTAELNCSSSSFDNCMGLTQLPKSQTSIRDSKFMTRSKKSIIAGTKSKKKSFYKIKLNKKNLTENRSSEELPLGELLRNEKNLQYAPMSGKEENFDLHKDLKNQTSVNLDPVIGKENMKNQTDPVESETTTEKELYLTCTKPDDRLNLDDELRMIDKEIDFVTHFSGSLKDPPLLEKTLRKLSNKFDVRNNENNHIAKNSPEAKKYVKRNDKTGITKKDCSPPENRNSMIDDIFKSMESSEFDKIKHPEILERDILFNNIRNGKTGCEIEFEMSKIHSSQPSTVKDKSPEIVEVMKQCENHNEKGDTKLLPAGDENQKIQMQNEICKEDSGSEYNTSYNKMKSNSQITVVEDKQNESMLNIEVSELENNKISQAHNNTHNSDQNELAINLQSNSIEYFKDSANIVHDAGLIFPRETGFSKNPISVMKECVVRIPIHEQQIAISADKSYANQNKVVSKASDEESYSSDCIRGDTCEATKISYSEYGGKHDESVGKADDDDKKNRLQEKVIISPDVRNQDVIASKEQNSQIKLSSHDTVSKHLTNAENNQVSDEIITCSELNADIRNEEHPTESVEIEALKLKFTKNTKSSSFEAHTRENNMAKDECSEIIYEEKNDVAEYQSNEEHKAEKAASKLVLMVKNPSPERQENKFLKNLTCDMINSMDETIEKCNEGKINNTKVDSKSFMNATLSTTVSGSKKRRLYNPNDLTHLNEVMIGDGDIETKKSVSTQKEKVMSKLDEDEALKTVNYQLHAKHGPKKDSKTKQKKSLLCRFKNENKQQKKSETQALDGSKSKANKKRQNLSRRKSKKEATKIDAKFNYTLPKYDSFEGSKMENGITCVDDLLSSLLKDIQHVKGKKHSKKLKQHRSYFKDTIPRAPSPDLVNTSMHSGTNLDLKKHFRYHDPIKYNQKSQQETGNSVGIPKRSKQKKDQPKIHVLSNIVVRHNDMNIFDENIQTAADINSKEKINDRMVKRPKLDFHENFPTKHAKNVSVMQVSLADPEDTVYSGNFNVCGDNLTSCGNVNHQETRHWTHTEQMGDITKMKPILKLAAEVFVPIHVEGNIEQDYLDDYEDWMKISHILERHRTH